MSRALLQSTGIVSLMTLLSRVLGFVRDVLFATAFGAGAGMDAFLVALKIPNFGRRLFAEGAFSQAFVPVFTEVRTQQGRLAARELLAVVSGTLAGVLAVLTLIGCLAAPALLWLFAPGFADEPDKQQLGAELLRWTFPYLMFISLVSLAGGVLNSYGRFAVPAATPVILNLCLISTAFIDAGSVRLLAYAVFLAGVLQLLAQLPALAQLGLLVRPRWAWRDSRVRRIVQLMVPILFGSSVAQISLLLDTVLASFLVTGSVSWLYYADRLMEFPLGIFTLAVATVILPVLSAQHADADPAAFRRTLDWGLRLLLLIGLPAALALLLLAKPLVITLFQYRAFGVNDVEMTAWALMAYAFGFLGFSLVKVLVPGYYARQETRRPVRFGILSLLVGMGLSLVLVGLCLWQRFPAPHAALALATSCSALLNAGLLYRGLRREGIYQPQPGWRRYVLQLMGANLVMVGVLLIMAGPAEQWLAASATERAADMGRLVLLAIGSYGLALLALGLRPREFLRRPGATP
ncbi:MAG TPA: murein biosynthesis integral membrane protein MurJ [Nevskiaceae bacterium]|nr:murein biosynthesis integral membrane protein MurJ [Nevskiaceae bacterium]